MPILAWSEVVRVIFGTLFGLVASSLFLLALFIGFCVVFNLPKLKPRGRTARVVRNLDERLGTPPVYLPSDAPRGTVDQLGTPELREARRRRSA
jgi:hypothetical protein